MFLEPKGRDWGTIVNWDDLGKIYAGFIISWTVILLFGATWLVINRHEPFIRIRNLPLAIASTCFLHVYLVKICLAYTTNGHFLCSAEYWIMSIYLPFGIALFQANLSQLRSISDQQQKFLSVSDDATVAGANHAQRRKVGLWNRWQGLSRIQKTYCFIGVGMTLQLAITLALYFTTPTLQGDWSSYGKLSYAKGQGKCRKSLQWIPTAFWQLFWAWIYGPYLLLRIRNIDDTHYWRAQVFLSVIAGLPGTPLWLAALFSPAFKPVNIRWVPPMWLAPGIIVMQGLTIFVPTFEAFRRGYQMRKTVAMLRGWDERSQNSQDQLLGSPHSTSSFGGSTMGSTPPPSSYRETELCTMASLEKALATNPIPLLKFAATRDFTAENVVFLMQVRRWHAAWASAPRDDNGEVTDQVRPYLFNMGVDMYTSSIHDGTTEFPINIESRIRSDLDKVFESAVPEGSLSSEHGEAVETPFGDLSAVSAIQGQRIIERALVGSRDSTSSNRNLTKTFWEKVAATEINKEPVFDPHPAVAPLGRTKAKIREGFDKDVFNAAEKSIKYLVLTNTWQKFVKDGLLQSPRLSGESS